MADEMESLLRLSRPNDDVLLLKYLDENRAPTISILLALKFQ